MATGSMLPDDGKSLAVADPRRQSAGRAAYGIQLGIFDEAGQPVPDGTTGEIWIRGASAMLGYWNKPEESRSEEHTSELQSLMRISYAVFCLKKKNNTEHTHDQSD